MLTLVQFKSSIFKVLISNALLLWFLVALSFSGKYSPPQSHQDTKKTQSFYYNHRKLFMLNKYKVKLRLLNRIPLFTLHSILSRTI